MTKIVNRIYRLRLLRQPGTGAPATYAGGGFTLTIPPDTFDGCRELEAYIILSKTNMTITATPLDGTPDGPGTEGGNG